MSVTVKASPKKSLEKMPKFRAGQVVCITAEFYTRMPQSKEKFQRVERVFPWKGGAKNGFGLDFENGDQCHEKFARELTMKEYRGL